MAETPPHQPAQAARSQESIARNVFLENPSYFAATKLLLTNFTTTSCKVTFNCFSSTTIGSPPPPLAAGAAGVTYCGGGGILGGPPSPYRRRDGSIPP